MVAKISVRSVRDAYFFNYVFLMYIISKTFEINNYMQILSQLFCDESFDLFAK